MTETLDDRLIAAASAPDVRRAVAALLKDSFDASRSRIARRLDAGGAGVEVAHLYSAAADELLIALWRFTTETLYPAANPSEAERLSLIAVGGYGRGVLAPFSDLDLLFLRPWKSIPRTEQVIEFMLYVLWDLGMKIGQSARSVDESGYCFEPCCTASIARSRLKLPGFWRGGKSRKLCSHLPMYAPAGAIMNIRSMYQRW